MAKSILFILTGSNLILSSVSNSKFPILSITLKTEFEYIQYSLTFTVVQAKFGEGNGNPLQYSCLENSMDGGAWPATVHGVAKSQQRLSTSKVYL